MRFTSLVIGGLLVAGSTLAGCASGPTITNLTLGRGAPFCADVTAFQALAASLEAASEQGDLAALRTQAASTVTAIQAMEKDTAKIPDKVNGHLVHDDLAIVDAAYQKLVAALAKANPSDANAIQSAVAAVQTSDGEAFTAATGRLDGYTKKVCGVSVSNPTSTTGGATTTTASGPPTTAGPAGPTAAPTTTPPATTTAP